jgi:hypothetical protein
VTSTADALRRSLSDSYQIERELGSGSFSAPGVLFRGPYDHATTNDVHRYDVTPDGNRFLMVKPVERPDALPVVVVLNRVEELKARMAR